MDTNEYAEEQASIARRLREQQEAAKDTHMDRDDRDDRQHARFDRRQRQEEQSR
jgi:hypothetical protein